MDPLVPLIATVVVAAIAFVASPTLVPHVARPAARGRLQFHLVDAAWALAGFLVMATSAVMQGTGAAGTWNVAVDLGAVAIGASLVATSRVQSWPRAIGLLILGIHLAQALTPIPFIADLLPTSDGPAFSVGPWTAVLLAAGATALGFLCTAELVGRLTTTRAAPTLRGYQSDVPPLVVGAAATIGVALAFHQATELSLVVDLAAFAAAASLVALSKPGSWPRFIGLVVLSVHSLELLVSNPDAPLRAAFADFHVVGGSAGSAVLDYWAIPHFLLPFLMVMYGLHLKGALAFVVGWEGVELAVRVSDPERLSWIAAYTPWVHEYESFANVASDVVLGLLGILLALHLGLQGRGVLGQRFPAARPA